MFMEKHKRLVIGSFKAHAYVKMVQNIFISVKQVKAIAQRHFVRQHIVRLSTAGHFRDTESRKLTNLSWMAVGWASRRQVYEMIAGPVCMTAVLTRQDSPPPHWYDEAGPGEIPLP